MKLIKLLLVILFITGFMQVSSAGDFLNILEPKDGVVTSNNVSFKWCPISVTGNYQIQVSTDLQFNNIIFDATTSATSINTVIAQTGQFYWRLRIIGTNFRSGWTDAAAITIFNPRGTNLLLWYSAQVGVPATGNPVPVWQDQSSNANDATQPTVSVQPIVQNGGLLLNNKKVVRFDGVDDFMTFTKVNTVRAIFLLVKHRTGTSGTYPVIMGDDASYDFHGLDGTALLGNGIASGSITGGQGYVNKVPTSPIVMKKYTNYSVLSFITTGNVTTSRITKDRVFGDRVWDGDYAEILLYNDTLNPQIRQATEGYLLNQYAPPVAIKDTVIGTNFCSNVTLTAPNNYTNYLWSTGSTAASISVPPNKKYWVTTKDVFGIQSTTYFNAFPYKRLNNAKVYICKGDTFKVDLKTPVGFTAQWNTGATTTQVSLYQTGTYTVKITDAGGTCFVWDTINLTVDNPQLSPVPDAFDSLRVCLNEKIFLNTATAFDSIRWSTGSTNTFISITAPGTYTAYGRTTTGCVINKTFKVKVNGEAPVAKFNYSSVCQNAATLFTDSSTHSAASTIINWKWTFGDGNSSVSQNASNTYSGLGTYTVGFKVTTNQNCFDSISKTIIVKQLPKSSFFNLLSCAGIPTTFVDQSDANSASITDWNWNFGGLGSISGINNPSFKFPSAGDYNVQLTVTNSNGCIKDTTIITTVEVAPVADFSYDSVCGITPVTFKFLGTVAPPNTIPNLTWGKWDFGDNQIETAIKSPQHVYSSPGTYEVKLIVNSSNQCVDTVVKQVKVFDFPVVDFDVSQTQCVGKEIQFTDISATPDGTPINSWNWFFSGQSTSDERNPRYTFNAEGNYIIQLTAKNAVGCTGTKLRSIAVSALPIPKFTFSPQNGLPPLCVTYTNQSPLSGNYLWSYGEGGPLIEGYNPPQHCYNTIGTYPIKLIATDFRGCTDTLTKYILVDKAYLDGVMTSITIIPTNGDFYKIQVSIKNNSNIQITDLGLSLQLGGGSVIRENWSGSLLPGQTTVYLFTGEIKLSENNQIPVVCASIDNVNNNAFEDRTDNNTTCKEVKVGNFDVFNIYPNPAYENINFGIMLPKDGRVNIRFIDILGQLMYNKDFDGLKGYNNFQMSTMPLNAAVYVAEIYYDGQIIRQKFMRKDRK